MAIRKRVYTVNLLVEIDTEDEIWTDEGQKKPTKNEMFRSELDYHVGHMMSNPFTGIIGWKDLKS